MSQEPQQSDPSKSADQNAPDKTAPKKRKRRWWMWVIVVLLVLVVGLVGLVLLGPTLASTSVVRSMVVGQVNANLNGSVTIADWSLGWFSPISVDGIKVYDIDKRLILEIPRIRLGISLAGAARQNFDLGQNNQIDIASFVVRVDENGKSNLEKLAKSGPSAPSKAPSPAPTAKSEPGKLPNVSGKFTINIAQGTIETPQGPAVHVDPSSIVTTLTSINDPVVSSIKLQYHVGDQPPSTIETSGSADAIDNNVVNIDKLAVKQKLTLTKVNLAAAEPFLQSMGPDTKVAGMANGSVDVTVDGLAAITASGNFLIENLLFAGGPLKGDQYHTTKVNIPISVKSTGDPQSSQITIEKVGLETDQLTIAVTGQVNQQALKNLAEQKAPGSDGSISIKTDVTGLKELASQLRNTLKLDKSVEVTSGAIHNDLTITLASDRVVLSEKLDASAKGKRDNKDIELKPITVAFSAAALPTGKPIPDARDIKLAFNSDFAKIDGGGASLAKIDINGNFDLGKLRTEAAQFADLGNLQLQGQGNLAINTDGDVANPDAPINAKATLNIQDAKVTGLASQGINQDRLAIIASGRLTRQNNSPTGIEGGGITVTSGDPASPMLAVDLGADRIDISKAKLNVQNWEIRKLDITDLAALQRQYGGLVPALDQQKIAITSGQLRVRGKGSFDGTTATLASPIEVSLPSLSVTREGRSVLSNETIRAGVGGSVSLGKEKTSASLTQLVLSSANGLFNVSKSGDAPFTVTAAQDGTIQGDGVIAIAANLKKLVDLAQAFSGQKPAAGQPELRSGQFDATIKLALADQTKIDFNGQIGSLTIFSDGKNAIDNEQLTIALSATAPSDPKSNTPITASGKIGSSFFNTTLSDIKLALQGGMLDMLQGANVDVQVPSIPKLYALAVAASGAPKAKAAPGAAPEPSMDITSGSATVKLAISRDSAQKATTFNFTELQVASLALSRGDRKYAFDQRRPIVFKLKAAATGVDEVESLEVQDLEGLLRVATLEMPQKITIAGLGTAQQTAKGVVKVTGTVDAVTPLLAVLQGADQLPYSAKYQLTQQLATSGAGVINLDGAIDVTEFKVLDKADRRKALFTEDQIAIKNNIDVDAAQSILSVKTLSVDMPKSQAVGVKFDGKVTDWVKARTISGTSSGPAKLDLTYDLEKIWPIVKPMLTPEMQQQYKDLKIKGKYTKTFTISGAYPDAKTPQQSLASLNLDGGLALDLLDLPQGVELNKFELPLKVTNGVLQLVAAPASNDRRFQSSLNNPANAARGTAAPREITAKTAICNSGALNLDGITVDLTQPSPVLTIPKKHPLLQEVKLNPILADSLGKLGAIILTGSSKAEGLTSMTIDSCDRVPLGDLLLKKKGARLQFTLGIEDLFLDGPVPQILSGAAKLGTGGLRGRVPPSVTSIENGQANPDLTFEIQRTETDARGRQSLRGLPMRMYGGVVLSTLELRDFKWELSPQLVRGDFAKAFPNGMTIPLKGTASKPEPDLAGFIKDNLINSIPGLLGGNKQNNSGTNNSQGQKEDPLGGLLKGLGGQNQQQPPAQNPPRRGP